MRGPVRRAGSAILNTVDPITTALWRRRSGRSEPVPPRVLRARVGVPSVEEWMPGGAKVAGELMTLLEEHGRPLDSFRSICDFGCGTGRILGHLAADPSAKVHAMDVDADAIGWLSRNRPGVEARVNSPHGPAPFPNGSFDLLFSVSVFTHLNAESQVTWLKEVSRLLAPGGLGVLTVLGESLRATWARGDRPGITERQREILIEAPPLADTGFVFAPEVRNVWNAWRYQGVEVDYGLAFWDRDAIRQSWSEHLEVEAIAPESINWRQDAIFVGRRRDAE